MVYGWSVVLLFQLTCDPCDSVSSISSPCRSLWFFVIVSLMSFFFPAWVSSLKLWLFITNAVPCYDKIWANITILSDFLCCFLWWLLHLVWVGFDSLTKFEIFRLQNLPNVISCLSCILDWADYHLLESWFYWFLFKCQCFFFVLLYFLVWKPCTALRRNRPWIGYSFLRIAWDKFFTFFRR